MLDIHHNYGDWISTIINSSMIFTMSCDQQRATFNLVVLFLTMIHISTSTVYYIIPNDTDSNDYSYDKDTNYNSLNHYLNSASKYFVSHNQFHFLSGQYYISDDLIFKDIKNFPLIGIDHCVITCTLPASVLIINVTNFVFQNIKLMNCIRSQKEYFNDSQTHFDSIYARDTVPFSEITQYYTSMFLYNSSSVNIIDTDTIATVMASFTAILIVNIQDVSKIINIKVQIKLNAASCTTYNYPIRTSGIVVYFSDGIAKESKLILGNFYYYIATLTSLVEIIFTVLLL